MRSGFIFLLAAPAAQLHAQSITVNPSRVFFSNAAGQTSSRVIKVTNAGSQPLVLNTSLQDFYRDTLGNKVYSAAGTLPASNAKWLTIIPLQLNLAAGETKDVTVTMTAPPGQVKPVTNSMLFLTQINAQKPVTTTDKNQRKVGVIIKLEVGIHIYNTLPGLSRQDMEFTAFEDRGTDHKDSTRLLALTVVNNGEVSTDARVRFELTNKSTGEENKLPPAAITMLPGAKQVIYFHAPAGLAKGTYLAEAILDTGNDNDLKVAQKDVVYE